MSLHKTFTCTFVLFAMLLLSNIGGEHLPYRDIPLGFLDISQYQDLYKNAFNNMNPLLKGPLIPVAEMVFDTVECILKDLSMIGCNMNTTLDLFVLLRQCSDGKGLLFLKSVVHLSFHRLQTMHSAQLHHVCHILSLQMKWLF
ncbi:uncharacterized protein [Parasteatoda tepidariorum]|uniref:uncharacterized protein isoform X5 n=1 Tax=Parasteatoda tepidariorum TaxID=114398 RepID=UPI0039BC2E63